MIIKDDPVYVRRRRVALAILVAVVIMLVWLLSKLFGGSDASADQPPQAAPAALAAPAKVEQKAPTEDPVSAQGVPGKPADTAMVQVQRITGGLTPKSVVASSTGLVLAQNMMYSHTVTAYHPDGARVKTISDAVKLADYGVKDKTGTTKGAPVEVAFSPDGSRAWVSNYAMYGPGFSAEGKDACTSAKGISNSYVYEVDTATFEITRVVEVGAVPKYVAVTPDGKQVLVTNWCSMDLTVIDAQTAKVVKTIPTTGKHPRGIAVSADSRTAYVAVMGDHKTVKIDLAAGTTTDFVKTGKNPRHLVTSPKGDYLYITNSGADTISKVDLGSGQVVATAEVGRDPRSMAISPDGGALYVVEYGAASVSKIRAGDMTVMDTQKTDALPIGVTYEPTKQRVWVACYQGSLVVFDDSRRAP